MKFSQINHSKTNEISPNTSFKPLVKLHHSNKGITMVTKKNNTEELEIDIEIARDLLSDGIPDGIHLIGDIIFYSIGLISLLIFTLALISPLWE